MASPPQSARRIYRFSVFEFDAYSGELRKSGARLHVQDQPLQVLTVLLERPGELVTREELRQRLWPSDTFVGFEHGLNAAVGRLRETLGDSAETPRFIETLPRRGYRFIGSVTGDGITSPASGVSIVENGHSQTDSDRRPAVQALNRPWWGRGPLLLMGCVVALILGAIALIDRGRQESKAEAPKLVPLTALSGVEATPTFSPDGEEVAFMWDGEKQDNSDIYLKMIGSADVRRLTTDPGPDFSPSWSPDGRQIAFLRDGVPSGNRIHVISPLGGFERQVSDFSVSEGPIAWSPDSRYVAAPRKFQAPKTPNEDTGGIYLVSVESGETRAITRTALNLDPHTMPWDAIQHSPAFSPDGRHLAFASCTPACDVEVVDLDASLAALEPARRLTKESVFRIGALTWSRDGKSIIYDTEAIPFVQYLWRIAADGEHPPERIEVGAGAMQPAIAQSLDRLAFVRNLTDVDIYRFKAGRPSQPVVASSTLPDGGPQYSPDGKRIVFVSVRSGDGSEIWSAAADGSAVQQLTYRRRPFEVAPHWSPDGRRIAFESLDADGHWHIWTIASEGGAPQRLTSDTADEHTPTWSQDGRWIYFAAKSEGAEDIFRVSSSAGGVKQQVTHEGNAGFACESADGKSLLYSKSDGHTPLLSLPLTGGRARQLVACIRSTAFAERPQGIYYLGCEAGENPRVHLMDRVTGEDKTIGVLEQFAWGWPTFGLAVSPDGTNIVYTRTVREGLDLMLIENFR